MKKTKAFKKYIQRKKQLKILNLFKKIEYDSDYNYKKQRGTPVVSGDPFTEEEWNKIKTIASKKSKVTSYLSLS